MSCRVWIWNYQGSKTAFGHASMSVYGGDPSGTYYVSWWPHCPPSGSERYWQSEKREYFGMCEPWRSRMFEHDVKAEFRNLPDGHVTRAGLDGTAIKTFWDDLVNDPQALWSATTTNCAATLA